MSTYYPEELGPCLQRIAAASERSADALEAIASNAKRSADALDVIAEESVKQTTILARVAEEHENQTWIMERIAVATHCQCICCTEGHWRADALIDVSLGHPTSSPPERLAMYKERLNESKPEGERGP